MRLTNLFHIPPPLEYDKVFTIRCHECDDHIRKLLWGVELRDKPEVQAQSIGVCDKCYKPYVFDTNCELSPLKKSEMRRIKKYERLFWIMIKDCIRSVKKKQCQK